MGDVKATSHMRKVSSISLDAASTLDPFAMWPTFPASDYYGSSVPPRRHQPTTCLPADQLAADR